MKGKVMVAMSGGVESSVAAFLLKKQGYEVVGVTMCLGLSSGSDEKPKCCGPDAIDDAKKVCDTLSIPHYVMDFSKELEDKVIRNFVEEYINGRTPNPCVECNKHIKFKSLLNKTLALGFQYLATGHYAAVEKKRNEYFLKRPKDTVKDQTYFLYGIDKNVLKSVLFPLSKFKKERVRKIARDAKLPVAEKPQSQDVCFASDNNYRSLIEDRTKALKSGNIIDLAGAKVGEHKGISGYTIGQRKGLGISSKKPLYVIRINPKKNEIIVGEREHLRLKSFFVKNVNILVDKLPKKIKAQIRYAHKEAECKIVEEENRLKVIFKKEQEAVTPGQSVVFYSKGIVQGGGVIEEVFSG